MSLNCNEINLILKELSLEGSFIQEIVQPNYDTLAMRIIKDGSPHTILVCTAQSSCRIHETKSRITKNAKPLRFQEFLRSRVQGMRINLCKELALERVIKLDVSTWKERLFIYIRLWSNAANIIVTSEDGTILDCMYRRPKKDEFSGKVFSFPYTEPTEEQRLNSLKRFPVRDFSELKEQWQEKNPGRNFLEASFNEKIDFFYGQYASSLSIESLLLQAQKWYTAKRTKIQGAIDHLTEKKLRFEGAPSLKHTGDLILANAALIEVSPNKSFLDCIDYDTGESVHIRLDAKKNVAQNAAYYYEQYKKAVSGLEELSLDIVAAQNSLSALDSEYKKLLSEKNAIKLEQLLRKDSAPRQKQEKPHPGLHYNIDGWTIMVGRTAAENDDLLRHNVRGSDLWLHTRDYAGGYVFIKAQKNKTVPLDILLYAGNLAVYHSKARKNAEANLYYTQVKHLRRAKNGPKGLVLPTQEKNLFVRLDQTRLRALEESVRAL